jgi:hypothetical protein
VLQGADARIRPSVPGPVLPLLALAD